MALTNEQLAFRRTGITATDIAALLGLDEYRTAWQVQQEKRGEGTFKGNLFTRAGAALEPVIAEQYAEDNAGVVLHAGATVSHPEHPRLIATPDYLVLDAQTSLLLRALEIKCVFNWATAQEWGPAETDEVPMKHFLQVQWQLGVLRAERADVARFYGGEVRYWRIAFDAGIFADMRDLALRWWQRHIVEGIECRPGAEDLEAVRRLPLKSAPDADVELATAEEAELMRTWRERHKALQEATKAAEDAEAKVLAAIGPRTGIQTKDGAVKVRFGLAKSPQKTDWPKLATKLGATPEDVFAFTSRGPEYRRPWCSWWNERKSKKDKA